MVGITAEVVNGFVLNVLVGFEEEVVLPEEL